jgi:hypothetical protein
MKELAMRMEKLPSSLVIHKRVATLDTKLAEMGGDFGSNPLDRNLGFYNFGRYTTAPGDANYAFEKTHDLWNEDLSDSDEQSDNDSSASDDNTAQENKTTTGETKENSTDRKRKKRKQNDTQDTLTPEKRTKRLNSNRTSGWLKEVWKEINESVDKLMIIQRHDDRRGPATWHVVQVDLDETNERQARQRGEYHVRHYVRHYGDAKKRLVRNCRQWPLTREIKPSGDFGDIVVIKPQKVDATLRQRMCTRGWHQSEANLAKDGLAGPFNFATIQGETHRIDNEVWKVLENCKGQERKSGHRRSIPNHPITLNTRIFQIHRIHQTHRTHRMHQLHHNIGTYTRHKSTRDN